MPIPQSLEILIKTLVDLTCYDDPSMLKLILLYCLVVCAFGGVSRVRRPRLDGRIVGDEAAPIEKYPYQLSLRSYGTHFCGASIISANFAVTAAHCTDGSLASDLSLRAGSGDRTDGGTIHQVSLIIQNANYRPKEMDYDISLLKVEEQFVYGTTVQPIKLPQAGETVKDGSEVDVSGWGTTSSGETDLPEHLLHVKIHVINQEECNQVYGKITDRMLCAGDEGKDSCQGDSGGPLVQNGKLVGIVSFGHGCAQFLFPGVYARVAALREWINDNSGV